jgi:hypothetical protein
MQIRMNAAHDECLIFYVHRRPLRNVIEHEYMKIVV